MTNMAGDFVWYELLTSDADAAQNYYGSILEWSFADSGQVGMDYRIIEAPEHAIGGVLKITSEMAAHGTRPSWLGYIIVDDVDARIAAIAAAGGQVLMPAMNIPDVGRIAMLCDPQGAPFYIMKNAGEGESYAFAKDQPRIGHCAWNELVTNDQTAAWEFYGTQFGWVKSDAMDMGPMGTYDFIGHDGTLGAIMKGTPEMGPPHWNQYFRVADIDVAQSAVEADGGTITNGPMEIPGGEFALNAMDPQGAAFGLVGPRTN